MPAWPCRQHGDRGFYVFLVVVAVLPFITTTNLWGWWFVTSAAFLLLIIAGWLVLRAFSVAAGRQF
ncbi:MAG: hypothetical protein KIS75_13680 [Chromatiales bacterium]|nr:hypothetical protein [Chromatiales bacterium]